MRRKTPTLCTSIKLRHISFLQTKKINLTAYNLASNNSYTNKIVSSSWRTNQISTAYNLAQNLWRCCLNSPKNPPQNLLSLKNHWTYKLLSSRNRQKPLETSPLTSKFLCSWFFFFFSNFHYPRYNLFNFSNFAHMGYKDIYPFWVVCKFKSGFCSRFAYGIDRKSVV